MSTINTGRRTSAPSSDGMVLFLIGMRINRYWLVWKWFPVLIAMPRMLIELKRNPELGLVGKPRLMVSGRVLMVWQYWKSFENLEGYARSADRDHLAAWRSFNRRIRDNGAVGIFHETILLGDDRVETIYANMPAIGLGAVTGVMATGSRGQTAGIRIGRRAVDHPPIDPY